MSEPGLPSRKARACGWIVLFFLGLYLLLSGEGFYSTDGETMLRATWAIVDHQRLSIPCDPGQPSALQGRDDRCFSRYGLGQPIAAVPLYMLGKTLVAAISALDYGETLRFVISRFNAIVTALTCGVVCALGRSIYRSNRAGVGLSLLYGLSTLAWPYSRYYFNEPLTALSLLLALYGVLAYRREEKDRWVLMGGAAFGYAVLTRTTTALWLPPLLVYLWLAARDWRAFRAGSAGPSRPYREMVVFLVPALALGLIQAIYQFWAFGSPFGGYEGEGWLTPLLLGLYGLLLSPGKSLLLFVPVTLLAPWAWITWLSEGRRREAWLFASLFLVWLLFHAAWWTWHGGWSWGPRFLVPVLALLILPLGSLWSKGPGARAAIAVLALLGFVVQLGGVLINFNDYMLSVNDEDKVLFDPAFFPILGHWRMLWSGARPDLAVLRMPVLGGLVWTLLTVLLTVYAGANAIRAARSVGRP